MSEDYWEKHWTLNQVKNVLKNDWWFSEKHFNEIPDFKIPELRQLYQRLYTLDDKELELLRYLYYKEDYFAIPDNEACKAFNMNVDEFKQKRLSALRKLQDDAITTAKKISRVEFYKKIEEVYGDILE